MQCQLLDKRSLNNKKTPSQSIEQIISIYLELAYFTDSAFQKSIR